MFQARNGKKFAVSDVCGFAGREGGQAGGQHQGEGSVPSFERQDEDGAGHQDGNQR